jgi:hypothetical protein
MHSETSLLRSYDNPAEFNAWTYDQAVGAIALLETDHAGEAERLLDAMLEILDTGGTAPGTAAYADGYVWDTRSEILGAETRATGPNAWMGLALLHGHLALPHKGYLVRATEIAEWLIAALRLQDPPFEGAFLGGIDPTEASSLPFQWISTEHNADMLAFLRGLQALGAASSHGHDWGALADTLEAWMARPVTQKGLWSPGGQGVPGALSSVPPADSGHFEVGYSDIADATVSSFPELLDSQTWSLLAFDASARVTGNPVRVDRIGLAWLDRNWQIAVSCGGEKRVGFAKTTFDPTTPETPINSYWTEGMAGYALGRLMAPPAPQALPRPAGLSWEQVVGDLHCFQDAPGGVLYSVGDTLDLCDYFDASARIYDGEVETCPAFEGPSNEMPFALFSNFTNLFGGEPGVFGDAEPDWQNSDVHLVSWFYPNEKLGGAIDPALIRSPAQSFALINDSDRSDRYPMHLGWPPGWNDDFTAWRPHDWASFTLTLAPGESSDAPPQPRDLSGSDELRFWARVPVPDPSEAEAGPVKIVVILTSLGANGVPADHHWPGSGGHALEPGSWQQIRVPLTDVGGFDRSRATAVGVGFGNKVDGQPLNADQAALWVDDFSFYPTAEPLPRLRVWPTNWAWQSVAASSWLVFAESRFNPFAVTPRTCNGAPATLAGTVYRDFLTATRGDDVIVGLNGNDLIRGLGGDDQICGGPGDDRILGGRGRDTLSGGAGDDWLFGGGGDDELRGAEGDDVLRCGRGHDLADGGGGFDRIAASCEEQAGDPEL